MLDQASGRKDPSITSIDHFVGTRDHTSPGDRRRAIVKAAHRLHEQLSSAPPVRYYRSCNIVRAPYPTKYALRDACSLPHPYIHILNRLFVVQYETSDGVKTLLVSPTDPDRSVETPFFRRLRDSMPDSERLANLLAPRYASVRTWLERIGISPAQVDYITFDHLHTQDVRGWLGTDQTPGLFPNAKLLITRQEWASARDLLPPQRDWYCPDGTLGVPDRRVAFFEGDLRLGESVVLMRTPGHTEGNHSIVVRTDEGVLVTSENGVSADCYAPARSRIPGLKRYARDTGMDIVINGNTLEGALDQYLSMVQEREVAGPSRRNPDFPNIMPSSELSPYWMFPGINPTFTFGELEFGTPHKST